MQRVFDEANIIECIIEENDLMAFLLSQDIDDNGEAIFPFNDLVDIIINALPEYAFADYEGQFKSSEVIKKNT